MPDYLSIWRRMCRCRAFELEVVKAHKAGRVKCGPIYLSIGQESIPSTVAELCQDRHVFTSHRCHSWFLNYGGDPAALRDELLGLPDGPLRGMCGSASLSVHNTTRGAANDAVGQGGRMFGHDGHLGSNVPIACGYALGSGRNTVCVMGDAGAEEDYALASFGFAATKKLPILFLVESNGLSILTPVATRRSWDIVDVARGFGLKSVCVSDEPEALAAILPTIELPALVEIKTTRLYWHAGSGQDGQAGADGYTDRYAVFRERLLRDCDIGPVVGIERIEQFKAAELWA